MAGQSEVQPIESAAQTASIVLPKSRTALKLPPLIRAMRPLQWSKNALVFAGLIFTHSFFELDRFLTTVAAALVFCSVSSAIYLVNDIRDVEQDRLHPTKRFRPIASGEISVRQAALTAVVLLVVGLVASFLIRPEFAAVIARYLV